MMADDVIMIDCVFGRRYDDLLLVRIGAEGPEATVYDTFPLNEGT